MIFHDSEKCQWIYEINIVAYRYATGERYFSVTYRLDRLVQTEDLFL